MGRRNHPGNFLVKRRGPVTCTSYPVLYANEILTKTFQEYIIMLFFLHPVIRTVENDNVNSYYSFIFTIFYYVLNILVCKLSDDGGYPPKHVAGIKKLYLYVYCMCKCFF